MIAFVIRDVRYANESIADIVIDEADYLNVYRIDCAGCVLYYRARWSLAMFDKLL